MCGEREVTEQNREYHFCATFPRCAPKSAFEASKHLHGFAPVLLCLGTLVAAINWFAFFLFFASLLPLFIQSPYTVQELTQHGLHRGIDLRRI